MALLTACAPLALFWPLLSRFNQQYGGTFWAQPQLLNAYTELLGVSDRWAAPLVAWLLIAIGATVFLALVLSRHRTETPETPIEDWVVAVAFIALPVITYGAGVTLGTAMVSRYTMSAVLGFSVAIVMLARHSRAKATPWVLLGVLLIVAAIRWFARAQRQRHVLLR